MCFNKKISKIKVAQMLSKLHTRGNFSLRFHFWHLFRAVKSTDRSNLMILIEVPSKIWLNFTLNSFYSIFLNSSPKRSERLALRTTCLFVVLTTLSRSLKTFLTLLEATSILSVEPSTRPQNGHFLVISV